MKKKRILLPLLSVFFLGIISLNSCSDKSDAPAKKEKTMAAKIEQIVQKYGQANKPGFAYRVHFENGIHYEGAVGLASVDPVRKLGVEDVFNIASVSKQFTAFAILLLEQQGKLSIDDSLYKYMPELGEYVKPITIAHLLSHSSGLADYMELANQKGIDGQYPLSREESLQHLSEVTQTNFEVGTQQDYSNTGYFLLAQIIEKISGMPLKTFSKQYIFDPLGMSHTFIADQYPIETAYVLSYNEMDQPDEVFWTHTGDGQVHSTVGDLMLWGENMHTGKVGGLALVQKFATAFPSHTPKGKEILHYSPYAYGIAVNQINGLDVLEHSGGWMSYNCNFIRIPSKKVTIAVLSNSANIDAVEISQAMAQALVK
ncbi:serine hydrolase domain-containing protein [Myroides odoratus]|uniref:serine hydrolase domain-containing protein n=1 Tax=Myroides odoratus TaxID=256 RepID=UPI0039AFDF26